MSDFILPFERAMAASTSSPKLAARVQGEAMYDALKKIVDEGQYAKINGQMVDLFSASAMVQVADALNATNRERFLGLSVAQAHAMTFRVMKKGSTKSARFSDGPEGEKEWAAWFKGQPKTFQDEWEKENEANKDNFTSEESMMHKTDEALVLPVEVEMHRMARAKLTEEDLYELDPHGELDDAGMAALHRVLQSGSNPEGVLRKADKMLRTHGVESLVADPEDYLADPFASYLNTGDMYNVTLAYVYPRGEWEITTLGDLRQEMEGGRFASREAASSSGLYGFTRKTQRDVEATVRKSKRRASRLAKALYAQDERSIPFLKAHAKRSKSSSAKLILAAMRENGLRIASANGSRKALDESQGQVYDALMLTAQDNGAAFRSNDAEGAVQDAYLKYQSKVARADFRAIRSSLVEDLGAYWTQTREASARTASDLKTGGMGLYGFPTKTARSCLTACTDFRSYVGEVTYDLHSRRTARWGKITGFMQEHSKTAKCGYSRMLLGCYPDAPRVAAQKAPPKEHQFTSEDNPNPKGNDKDGDGKTNEKKPFKEAGKVPHPKFEGASDAEIASAENRNLTIRQLAWRYGKTVDEIKDILNTQARNRGASAEETKLASFGFAHKPLWDLKKAIEAGEDEKLIKDLYAKAGDAIVSLSSSKSIRARDFRDELKALAATKGIKLASPNTEPGSVAGWLEWQE